MTKTARTKDDGAVMITCRQASVLLSKREDLPLGRIDRIKLRLHLAICSYCRNVARQFAGIRLAMRKWRDRDG
jgi:predicted anti-sigma-YlaC factor YlaD